MYFVAKPARDPFTFSLQGMAAVGSFVFAPAIPQDAINKAWDSRLGGTGVSRGRRGRRDRTLRIEVFLARYFAPGSCCCDAS
jgi:hypothetical protein